MKKSTIKKRQLRKLPNSEYIQYLRDDVINVLHVPVGKMPKGKAEEYLHRFIESVKPMTEGYKIIYLAKFDKD
jgi:hypothetical protein